MLKKRDILYALTLSATTEHHYRTITTPPPESLAMHPSHPHLSEPTTVPLPSDWPNADWISMGSLLEDNSTRVQDDLGNLQPQKCLFKNRFKIIQRLGRGGFSTTYLAQDITTTHPMPCVIKHLKRKVKTPRCNAILELERMNRRFQREVRMMARLGRHNQLPRLLDHFIEGDQFYLVQEHVSGLTLNQVLARSGPLSETQVKQFLGEMIPVIRYIHRQRLLHLDIKPSNIIRRDSDQKLVLIDFGAVRRYPPEASENRSATKQAVVHQTEHKKVDHRVGTIGFSPIEQLSGEPTYASDIYALGVTCLTLLTATSPLDFATSPKGQNLRWQESVQLSVHFTGILEKMLNPDLTRRFQNIEALDRALKLEDHYDELKTCMTTKPLTDPAFKSPSACRLNSHADTANQSHTQRQAASIRRWQQRRRQFKTFTPK